MAVSVSRGCLHNIGIIESHLTLATQTQSSAGRITDDNKILVYCNEIKSTLIHLKYTAEHLKESVINTLILQPCLVIKAQGRGGH